MTKPISDEFAYAATTCSDATGGQVKPRIFRVCLNTAALEYARAVLARWGNHFPGATKMVSPAPVLAEGEVAELVAWLRTISKRFRLDQLGDEADRTDRAADLLSQHHPAPVPVSERLPGPEDCDEEGFCWWFSPSDPSAGTFGVAACWVLRKHEPEDDFRTHWLPAHALPLPSVEVEA